MKIAIISDIHSNCYSLEAFIKELEKSDAEIVFCCGDIFGYYPWAARTFSLLNSIKLPIVYIKGNHDQMILDKMRNSEYTVDVSYWHAVEKNLAELVQKAPEAIELLEQLSFKTSYKTSRYTYTLVHGSPDDEENGRYYPDDEKEYTWFPESNEVLILGHTHYPLYKTTDRGGTIINTGSIGQPRDGDVDPSWGFWNEETGEFELLRYKYDIKKAVAELEDLHWDERAIKALQKDKQGKLSV